MKAASKWTLIALTLILGATTSMAAVITNITFGSNNNGDGGFTAVTDLGSWSLGTDAMIFTNSNTGRDNAGVLGNLSLTNSAGNKYSFNSTFNVVQEGRANSTLRFALSLFTTSDTVAGLDTGIHLVFIDSEVMQIGNGINTFDTTTNTAWTGAAFGPGLFTLDGDVAFVGTDVVIDFKLTDYNSYSQTLSFTTAASGFTLGEYAGVGMRTRAAPSFIGEVQTFSASVDAIPEPSTFGMVAVMGSALFFIRRRIRISKRID